MVCHLHHRCCHSDGYRVLHCTNNHREIHSRSGRGGNECYRPVSHIPKSRSLHLLIRSLRLYNGETAPKALRGTLLVLYQLQIIIGCVDNSLTLHSAESAYYSIFVSYILDLATHAVPNSASWRVPVGLQLLWGLILLSGIFFLPESPYVLFRSLSYDLIESVQSALIR